MRLYLAGKVTGDPGYFAKFMEAAHDLRRLGHEVKNPVEINFDKPNWTTCMRRDIAALMECDAICLLDDWTRSPGAKLEQMIATEVGIRSIKFKELLAASKPLLHVPDPVHETIREMAQEDELSSLRILSDGIVSGEVHTSGFAQTVR